MMRAAQQSDASMNGSDTTAAGDAIGPEAELLAAVDPLALGDASAQLIAGLARNPLGVLQAFGTYASGLAAATSAGVARALGADAPGPVEPGRKDKRFADPTWQENPAYFWLQQSYLLFGRLAQDLVEAGAGSGPGAAKLRLAAEIVVDAMAPTNVLPGNPAALSASRQPRRAQACIRDRRRVARPRRAELPDRCRDEQGDAAAGRP